MSGRKFKVGDRVRVIRRESACFGQECSITSGLFFSDVYCCIAGRRQKLWVHAVDIPPRSNDVGREVAFEPSDLEPIYDGNQLTSWSDCAWQPKRLIVETDTFVPMAHVPETP